MTAIVINNTGTALLPIQTVAPSNLELGEVMVSADKRNSKGEKELSDSERIRRVVLPKDCWQPIEATIAGTKSQGLTDILRGALRGIANDRLRDKLAEEPQLQQVALTDFTISSLLAWSEETASSRGSLTFTREQVEEWYKDSATKKNLAAKWMAAGKSPDQMKQLSSFAEKRFATLAAKNHGLKDAADADKLMALVAPEDAETGIGADVVGRIAHISKTLAAKAAEAAVSMDDL